MQVVALRAASEIPLLPAENEIRESTETTLSCGVKPTLA
jgi:hypothetical protein